MVFCCVSVTPQSGSSRVKYASSRIELCLHFTCIGPYLDHHHHHYHHHHNNLFMFLPVTESLNVRLITNGGGVRVGSGVHDKLHISSADWSDLLLPLA